MVFGAKRLMSFTCFRVMDEAVLVMDEEVSSTMKSLSAYFFKMCRNLLLTLMSNSK